MPSRDRRRHPFRPKLPKDPRCYHSSTVPDEVPTSTRRNSEKVLAFGAQAAPQRKRTNMWCRHDSTPESGDGYGQPLTIKASSKKLRKRRTPLEPRCDASGGLEEQFSETADHNPSATPKKRRRSSLQKFRGIFKRKRKDSARPDSDSSSTEVRMRPSGTDSEYYMTGALQPATFDKQQPQNRSQLSVDVMPSGIYRMSSVTFGSDFARDNAEPLTATPRTNFAPPDSDMHLPFAASLASNSYSSLSTRGTPPSMISTAMDASTQEELWLTRQRGVREDPTGTAHEGSAVEALEGYESVERVMQWMERAEGEYEAETVRPCEVSCGRKHEGCKQKENDSWRRRVMSFLFA